MTRGVPAGLILGALGAAAAGAAPIYFDGFEGFAPGTDLTDATYTPEIGGVDAAHFSSRGGTVTAIAFGEGIAASLDLPAGTAQDYLGRFFTTYTDVVVSVDWEFTAAEVNGGFGGFFARFPTPTLDMQVLLGFLDDGRVIVFDDTPSPETVRTIGSFAAETLYHVRMALDLHAGTYSVWLDDLPMLEREPLPPHINATSMHQFGFDVNESLMGSLGNRYVVDNVRVEIGPATPVPALPATALGVLALLMLALGLRTAALDRTPPARVA